MSSVEAAVSRSERITALVLEVQARRARGDDSRGVAGDLVSVLMSTLRRVANRFTKSARGALDLDDLVQVGAIQLLRFLDRYEHGRGAVHFEKLVEREAMRVCGEQIRLHATSIRVTDYARDQSRNTGEELQRPRLADVGAAARLPGAATPEALLAEAQTRNAMHRALNRLPRERRDLVQRLYGIGVTQQSSRDLAGKGFGGRSRISRETTATLTAMRAEVG